MLKKVPSMRKKHAEPSPGSPDVGEQQQTTPGQTTPPPTIATRKKTGVKRASVFGALFGRSSKAGEEPINVDAVAEPSPAGVALSDDKDPMKREEASTITNPPSPRRDASSSSPPMLMPRKGSKDTSTTTDVPSSPIHGQQYHQIFDSSERISQSSTATPTRQDPPSPKREVTIFEESARKEPSRSNKMGLMRAHSRKELMQARREGSKVEGLFPQGRPSKTEEPAPLMNSTQRKEGSRASPSIGPRFVMSARLPAMTIDQNEMLSVNSFLSAQQMLDSRPRAESDPLPIYASTLEDDFGFEDEINKKKSSGLDGSGGRAMEDDDEGLLSRKSSFQKPRAPSFNAETRQWEGRRSLQLSVNTKPGEIGGTVHVSAATLDRLVEYVVSSNEFMEAGQVSGFLLTYHSYVNSQGLLSALASRYEISTSANDQVARIRTLYVLQRWIEEHWYDFESDDILLMGVVQFAQSRLKDYEQQPPTSSGSGGDTAPSSKFHQNDPCYGLLKKLATVQQLAQSKLEKKRLESVSSPIDDDDDHQNSPRKTFAGTEVDADGDQQQQGGDDAPVRQHGSIAPRLLKHQSRLLIKLEKAPALDLPSNFAQIWQNKLEGKPMHVILASSLVSKLETARQITVMEHNMYKRIPPTEIIAQATKQLAKPPEHVRGMIAHFNDMSKFVSYSICSFTELTPRVYMLRKWIKIGRECLRLNNYNAVFEIMAGIHSVAVHRLHRTHGALNIKTRHILEKLEEVTSRKNNYATYRTLLAQNTVPIQPAVPFIGATLTDLSFLDFGHRNMVENGEGDTLINFTKHRRVAQVMGTIKKFQDHPYLLDESPELSRFIQQEMTRCAQVTDKEMYSMSLACEPLAQTAGGQAQMAFFDFESNPANVGGNKMPFLFGGFKKT